MYQIEVSKAIAAGLRIRSVKETIEDTWTWLQLVDGTPSNVKVGIDVDKEKTVLESYCS